jgi:hypothetical protein
MPTLAMLAVAVVLWSTVVVAVWVTFKHPGGLALARAQFRGLLYAWGALGVLGAAVAVLVPLATHTFLPGGFYAWLFGGVWAPVFLTLGTFARRRA